MYYYKHTNGTIHQKPDFVVESGGGPSEYFDSPFVEKWWYEDHLAILQKLGQEFDKSS